MSAVKSIPLDFSDDELSALESEADKRGIHVNVLVSLIIVYAQVGDFAPLDRMILPDSWPRED